MAALAQNIAASESPDQITLELKNISSLDAARAAAIQAVLVSDLKTHSFKVAPQNSVMVKPALQMELTLSESATAYVWAVQTRNAAGGDTDAGSTNIVSVSKEELSADTSNDGSLYLDRKLVWKQRGEFLDFAVLATSSGDSRLLVLEADRMVSYQMTGSDGQVVNTSPISPSGLALRNRQGVIDVKTESVWVGMMRCTGYSTLAEKLDCKTSQVSPGLKTSLTNTTKGIGTTVAGICGTAGIDLFTGEGDWTQPDSIQGYLVIGPDQVEPSGNTIAFDGPVMALHADDESGAARAVVHNLKTGNYEAYTVTATCNH